MKSTLCSLATIVLLCLVGCKSQPKSTVMDADDKRAAILKMSGETLDQLYGQHGTARQTVMRAPGYAVFSDVDMPVTQMGTAEGYGVVIDNTTKLPTYMKMSQTGDASTIQLKDYRLIFVFRDRETMQKFMKQGSSFGADTGRESLDEKTADLRDIKIYQITHDGVVLRATVPNTRYWFDNELN